MGKFSTTSVPYNQIERTDNVQMLNNVVVVVLVSLLRSHRVVHILGIQTQSTVDEARLSVPCPHLNHGGTIE